MIKTPENVDETPIRTARSRKTNTQILLLLPKRPSGIAERVEALPKAVRRMLEIVVTAMRQGRGTAEGVTVWKLINRAAIAEALDKPALIPYDIEKLRKLHAAGLLVETVETNPRDLGGREFVYSVPPDLLPALVEHFDHEAFAQRRAALAVQAEQAAQQRAAIEEARRLAHKPRKYNWLERIAIKLEEIWDKFYTPPNPFS